MRVGFVLVAMVVVGSGCGGRATPAGAAEPSCRDLALRAEVWIAQVGEAERETTLRFAAEVIDLCQAPGLAVRARTCLLAAGTVAEAHTCPSMPATGRALAGATHEPAPRCKDVVAHALDLADRPPDGPLTPEERADETQTRTRQCDAITADGRRCAAAAETLDDLEQCIADHDRTDAEDAEEIEDLLKNPFQPRP